MFNSLSRSPAATRPQVSFSLYSCRWGQPFFHNNTKWRKVSAHNDPLINVCGFGKEKKEDDAKKWIMYKSEVTVSSRRSGHHHKCLCGRRWACCTSSERNFHVKWLFSLFVPHFFFSLLPWHFLPSILNLGPCRCPSTCRLSAAFLPSLARLPIRCYTSLVKLPLLPLFNLVPLLCRSAGPFSFPRNTLSPSPLYPNTAALPLPSSLFPPSAILHSNPYSCNFYMAVRGGRLLLGTVTLC